MTYELPIFYILPTRKISQFLAGVVRLVKGGWNGNPGQIEVWCTTTGWSHLLVSPNSLFPYSSQEFDTHRIIEHNLALIIYLLPILVLIPSTNKIIWLMPLTGMGFPHGAVVENPPANAGDSRDMVSTPVGKSPWRKWQPTPASLPGKFYVEESSGLQFMGQTWLSDLSTHTHPGREEVISTETGETKRWDLTGQDQSNCLPHVCLVPTSLSRHRILCNKKDAEFTWICHSLACDFGK